MARLQLVVLALWLYPACIVVASPAEPAPITSKAALTRYLHDTPPGTSPLDALSPGGKKRFLARLQFGQNGLRGFSLDDPDSELTHPQIVQLLALFGAQEYAGEGITPAEQARLESERARDATARGCAVDACPESEVEKHYDAFVLHEADPSLPDNERSALAGQRYDRLFGQHQAHANLRSTSDTDLRLLKRAAENIVFLLPDPFHITQLRGDLAEMQRRGMVDDKDFAGLHRALVASRDFDAAGALAKEHPDMGTGNVPVLHAPGSLPAGQPTALVVDAQGEAMWRRPFDLSTPLRIVVVASCHFSKDAARAIEADAQLRSIFSSHAIWLASQNESFSAVSEWNREFPDQPIRLAWQDGEWSMLDSWAMPTFYVFRDGHLEKKFSGWHGTEALKRSLREAGVP